MLKPNLLHWNFTHSLVFIYATYKKTRRKWLAHILVDFKIIIAHKMSKIAFLHFVIMLLLLLALWETKENGPSEWKRKITSWCFVFVIIGHRVEWNRILGHLIIWYSQDEHPNWMNFRKVPKWGSQSKRLFIQFCQD